MKEILIKLYQAINSDYSIKRFTLGWETVTSNIKRRYESTTDPKVWDKYEYFSNDLLKQAYEVATGSMKWSIESFARELEINLETLRSK